MIDALSCSLAVQITLELETWRLRRGRQIEAVSHTMGSLGAAAQRNLEAEHKGVYDEQLSTKEESQVRNEDGSPPQIHYFAKPNSTTLGTVLIIIFYHMMPFTGLPQIGLGYLAYYLQQRSPFIGLTAYLGFLLLLLLAPPYYSKTVRRKVRVLYEALAVYVPSAKFIIVPTEPLPQDKATSLQSIRTDACSMPTPCSRSCMRFGESLSSSLTVLFPSVDCEFFSRWRDSCFLSLLRD